MHMKPPSDFILVDSAEDYFMEQERMSTDLLPGNVVIMGMNFKVTWSPGTVVRDDEEVFGVFLPSSREIIISLMHGKAAAALTLVHEIGHAIFHLTGREDRELLNEDFAVLSELVASVLFIENPELGEFLKYSMTTENVVFH